MAKKKSPPKKKTKKPSTGISKTKKQPKTSRKTVGEKKTSKKLKPLPKPSKATSRHEKAKKVIAKPPIKKIVAKVPTKAQTKTKPWQIAAINPRTRKIIQRPVAGRNVRYGLVSPTGKVIPIQSEYSQKFAAKDKAALEKILKVQGPENFVVYEQLTKEFARDSKGQIEYKTKKDKKTGKKSFVLDGDGNKIPKYRTKITSGKSGIRQRPIYMRKGKHIRSLDLGFRARSRRELVDQRIVAAVPVTNQWTNEIFLEGPTIRSTVKLLMLDVRIKEMAREDLEAVRFEIIIRIYGKEPIVVYGSSAFKKRRPGYMFEGVREDKTFKEVNESRTIANFTNDVARSIRYRLADHGLRFTSLFDLMQIHDGIESDAKKMRVKANKIKNKELREEALEDAGEYGALAYKVKRVGQLRYGVDTLQPIFPEWKKGPKAGQDVGDTRKGKVSIMMRIAGRKRFREETDE